MCKPGNFLGSHRYSGYGLSIADEQDNAVNVRILLVPAAICKRVYPGIPDSQRDAAAAMAQRESNLRPSASETAVPAPGATAPLRQVTKNESWKRLEEKISANWTGILGAIILVLGAGFLAVYAALSMGPFFRFLLVLAISGGLFAGSLFLKRRKDWEPLSYWIRSSSGAVLLLACLGSAMIPGMQWVQNENLALAIILIGVAANLFFAWTASAQTFATIHVLLSVIALLILPPNALTLSCIGGVSLFSAYLSHRSKWEFHLLQTMAVFFLANLIFGYRLGGLESITSLIRWPALGWTTLVSITALSVHYRSRYSTAAFERWPFLSHTVSWAAAAAGFALYSTGSRWNTPVLFLVALAVYLNARRARKISIRWLYVTDSLISLFIALAGAITLGRWSWDALSIMVLSSALILVFLVAAAEEDETIPRAVGSVLLHLSWIAFAFAFFQLRDPEKWAFQSALIDAMTCIAWAATYYAHRRPSGAMAFDDVYGISGESVKSPSGLFAGLFFALMNGALWNQPNTEFILPAAALVFVALNQSLKLHSMFVGHALILVGLHALVSYRAFDHSPIEQLIADAPLMALLMAMLLLSAFKLSAPLQRIQALASAAVLALHITFFAAQLSSPYSELLPGLIWLLLSIVALELMQIAKRTNFAPLKLASESWEIWGLALLVLFLGSHLFFHLQSEELLWVFRQRLLIQLLAVAVFAYWAFAPSEGSLVFGRIRPWFWELILVFISMAAGLELGSVWLPVLWSAMAITLDFTGRRVGFLSRFRVYGMAYFWTSAIHTATISSGHAAASAAWMDQLWVGGLVAIVGQLAYLVLVFKSRPGGTDPSDNIGLHLAKLNGLLNHRRNTALFYPVFLSIALFLYWTFDHSLLTLLWMVEVFAAYSISLYVREEHFRYAAIMGLGLCLIRLIFWDLNQSTWIMRALVFLGVGFIMILMNTLYNRFRDRLDSNKENE